MNNFKQVPYRWEYSNTSSNFKFWKKDRSILPEDLSEFDSIELNELLSKSLNSRKSGEVFWTKIYISKWLDIDRGVYYNGYVIHHVYHFSGDYSDTRAGWKQGESISNLLDRILISMERSKKLSEVGIS